MAERYRAELGGLDALELPPAAPDGDLHAYHLFVVRHRDGAAARRRLYDGPSRARDRRPGPLHPGLPPPVLPRHATATRPASAPRPRPTTRAASRCRASRTWTRSARTRSWRPCESASADELPSPVRDRRARGRRRSPDLRDRRGRRQPQPRPRPAPAADRRRRRRRGRRGQVPDLLGERGSTRARRRGSSTWRRSPTRRRPSCSRRSRCRASGRPSSAPRARARDRLLLHPVRPRGGRGARRARRAGAEDRLVRDRRPAADRGRRGDRTAAPDLDRDGDARRDRGGARRGASEAGAAAVGLMQCTSIYPAGAERANLRAMATMREAFGVPVGLSDHTMGIAVPIAAAALGAAFVEKHFTLDRDDARAPTTRSRSSRTSSTTMVAGIREAQAALGDGSKERARPRRRRRRCTRSRAAAWSPPRDLPAGTTITREMITIKRPGYGIAPKHLDLVLGRPRCTSTSRRTRSSPGRCSEPGRDRHRRGRTGRRPRAPLAGGSGRHGTGGPRPRGRALLRRCAGTGRARVAEPGRRSPSPPASSSAGSRCSTRTTRGPSCSSSSRRRESPGSSSTTGTARRRWTHWSSAWRAPRATACWPGPDTPVSAPPTGGCRPPRLPTRPAGSSSVAAARIRSGSSPRSRRRSANRRISSSRSRSPRRRTARSTLTASSPASRRFGTLSPPTSSSARPGRRCSRASPAGRHASRSRSPRTSALSWAMLRARMRPRRGLPRGSGRGRSARRRPESRRQLAARGQEAVDGYGALRVVFEAIRAQAAQRSRTNPGSASPAVSKPAARRPKRAVVVGAHLGDHDRLRILRAALDRHCDRPSAPKPDRAPRSRR